MKVFLDLQLTINYNWKIVFFWCVFQYFFSNRFNELKLIQHKFTNHGPPTKRVQMLS